MRLAVPAGCTGPVSYSPAPVSVTDGTAHFGEPRLTRAERPRAVSQAFLGGQELVGVEVGLGRLIDLGFGEDRVGVGIPVVAVVPSLLTLDIWTSAVFQMPIK